jgi:hypothetical protein
MVYAQQMLLEINFNIVKRNSDCRVKTEDILIFPFDLDSTT